MQRAPPSSAASRDLLVEIARHAGRVRADQALEVGQRLSFDGVFVASPRAQQMENRLREEGVQERGLAALKLPDAGNVEPSLGDALCEGSGFRSEGEELQLGGDPSERFKTA
jgi:hypothetical protein